MIDEYGNKKAPEYTPLTENKPAKEVLRFVENKMPDENVAVKENLDFNANKKDKAKTKSSRNKAMSVLTSSLVGVVGVVVAGMTNLLNVKFKAEFDSMELRLSEDRINYSISVKDMTEKEYLMIYPERDGVKLDGVKLIDEDGDGVIKGFYPIDKEYINAHTNKTVKYVFNLRGLVGLDVERLFDRYVVPIKNYQAEFKGVEGHCECGVDGYYYFTMDFKDEGGLFKDFEAYIVDTFYDEEDENKDSHIAYCTFNDNLHSEQRIFVGSLQGSNGRLFIKYKTADGVQHVVKDTEDGLDGIKITM